MFRSSLKLPERTLSCVDKVVEVSGASSALTEKFREMYKEFRIGCELDHPNIVNYHYFLRRQTPSLNQHELHIIMELCEGGNLKEYLDSLPEKRVTDLA